MSFGACLNFYQRDELGACNAALLGHLKISKAALGQSQSKECDVQRILWDVANLVKKTQVVWNIGFNPFFGQPKSREVGQWRKRCCILQVLFGSTTLNNHDLKRVERYVSNSLPLTKYIVSFRPDAKTIFAR